MELYRSVILISSGLILPLTVTTFLQLFYTSNSFSTHALVFMIEELVNLRFASSPIKFLSFISYALRPQQFLYFLPLPHGHGSFGYTFVSLFTGVFAAESSLLVPVTFATCSLSTFCSIFTWNNHLTVSSRILSVMAPNIS